MREYIERVTALNALIRALGYCQCANDVITRIPAADVAEVRHGCWEEASDGDGVVCSECGTAFCTMIHETEKFRFCPNCGALMQEEDNGEK